MNNTTLNELLLDSLRRYDKPDLLRYKQSGTWQTISSRTFLRRAASLAHSLQEQGVRRGDRVALFSENRPEWHITDVALLGLGAITVPVYPAESAERLRYILANSGSRLCLVAGPPQWEKVLAVWKECAELETVISFAPLPTVLDQPGKRVLPWGQAVRDDVSNSAVAEFERQARACGREDVATLIYTSGTTGRPKGALLTQGNFASNVLGTMQTLKSEAGTIALSLLPLCHIFERTTDYTYFVQGVSIAYAESLEKVRENLREVRPHVMAVVPRFFEKFYARLQERLQGAPPLQRKILAWAERVGREALPFRLAGKTLPLRLRWRYTIADALVYRKLRVEMGGRIRHFVSGGAPLARELNEFFHALGLTIYEGYGLTETSPVIAVNVPGAVKLGTVGRPILGVEVKTAPDGEILTRGPHVMKGYYRMEEETQAVLRDGWLATGDVGFLDDDGFLTITDRKKDLIKTAAGKFVAPQPIENQLKQSPYIQNAVVVGDRRKYVVALLVPNYATLEQSARARGLTFSSRTELLTHPEVRASLAAEVERVNCKLAQYERLKRFAPLEQEFSFDSGQLTYTQKVRRRKIEEQYRDLIESLYAEEPAPGA
ncbi:MAG: AMP-dependent synthetase/ligase [Terriglobia bacterium]